MLRQYDIVQIITTKGIKYVSGPPGQPSNPNGNWSIVGFIDGEALIAKDSTLAKVPIKDLRKIGTLDIDHILQEISKAGYLSGQKINMSAHLATTYGITIAKARKLLRDHNYRTVVNSIGERDSITSQIAKVLNGKEERKD